MAFHRARLLILTSIYILGLFDRQARLFAPALAECMDRELGRAQLHSAPHSARLLLGCSCHRHRLLLVSFFSFLACLPHLCRCEGAALPFARPTYPPIHPSIRIRSLCTSRIRVFTAQPPLARQPLLKKDVWNGWLTGKPRPENSTIIINHKPRRLTDCSAPSLSTQDGW